MKKSNRIAVIITIFFLVLSMSAWTTVNRVRAAEKQSLSIGAMASVDVIPIVIASEKGFFKKEGVDVKLQSFKSSRDRDAAFQGGNLDGIIGDEVAICLYQNAGFDVKITGATDGDFMLVANTKSGIKIVAALKDKSIAISEKTAIEYTLDKILEKNHIDPKSVKKIIVPPIPARLELLRNNKVDAALLPEPFSTLAIKSGGVLLGSASKLATYPSVTAFTQKSIDSKSSEIKAFYRAYNDAVGYLNRAPVSEYEDLVIRTVGYPAEMKGKIVYPRFKRNILPPVSDVKSVIDWAVKKKLVRNSMSPANLMNNIGIVK